MAQRLVDFVCSDVARVLIAVILVTGSLALLFTGREVPDVLWALDGAAVGFYFGGMRTG